MIDAQTKIALDSNLGNLVRISNPHGEGWVEGLLGRCHDGDCRCGLHEVRCADFNLPFYANEIKAIQWNAKGTLEIGLR